MTKKHYSIPKVIVGAVKKSIAAITSRWLLKNAAHRLEGSGFRGALRIQRRTVRSEMWRDRKQLLNATRRTLSIASMKRVIT